MFTRPPFRIPNPNLNLSLFPNPPYTRRRRPALTPADSDCSSEAEHYHNPDYDFDYDCSRANHLRYSAQRNTLPLPSPSSSFNRDVLVAPAPALTTLTLTLPTASADRLSVGAGELLILPAAPLVRVAVQICVGRRGAKVYRAAVVEGVRLKDVVRQLVGQGEAKVFVKVRGEWVETGGGVRVSELVGGRRGEVEVRIVVGEGGGGGVMWEREMGLERERVYVY